MKTKLIILLPIAILMFTSCNKEKVPDNLKPIEKLFANDGVWYVEQYIANGVDSTKFAFPNYKNNVSVARLEFKTKKAKDFPNPVVYGKGIESLFEYKSNTNGLKFSNGLSACEEYFDEDCCKNIFKIWCGGSYWLIKSINENRVEITCQHDDLYNKYIAGNYSLVLVK